MNTAHIFKSAAFNYNGIGIDLFDAHDDLGTFLGKVISCEEEAIYDAIKAYPTAIRVVYRGAAYPVFSAEERHLISIMRDQQCLISQCNYASSPFNKVLAKFLKSC